MPLSRLDRLPPRNGESDFVAACHEDVAVVGKDMLPNLGSPCFLWWTSWEFSKCFGQLAEMWFTERMIDSKNTVGRASKFPYMGLKFNVIRLVKIIKQIRFAVEPFAGCSGNTCGFKRLT